MMQHDDLTAEEKFELGFDDDLKEVVDSIQYHRTYKIHATVAFVISLLSFLRKSSSSSSL